MKKVILAALLAVIALTSSFAAGESKISYVVLNSFKVDFKDAKNVLWTTRTGYSKAAFTVNNRQMEVYYNTSGEIMASSKNIDLDELPVKAKRIFAKKYEGYTVKEAIRFEGINEDGFFISAENEKENVIIKIDDNSNSLSIFKKTKK